MLRIDQVLSILYLIHLVTSNDQVLVLKYNKRHECPNSLVELPVPSMKELTFCGKYNLRFLRNCHLMGFDKDSYLWLMNYDEKMAALKMYGEFIFFNFKNQTSMEPDRWQHFCFSVSTNQVKIALNGEILHHETVDFTSERIKSGKLWLGGTEDYAWGMMRRLEGAMTDVNLWNTSLEFQHLISITSSNDTIEVKPPPNIFSWATLKIKPNTSCVEYITLDKNDELFKEKQHKNVLIEYNTDFNSSNFFCQAFGGNLLVPKTEQDLKEIDTLCDQSKICGQAFLGLLKFNDTMAVDLNGKPAPFIKWGNKQPNGKNFQKCISVWYSGFDDVQCHAKFSFACQIIAANIFTLRGNLSDSIERQYFVHMRNTQVEIRGILKTECIWNGTWNFGQDLILDKSTSNMPPVGVRKWSRGNLLKFTQCKENEFTCHTYGQCISMNKRCNGFPDCYPDGSDENNCKTMTLARGYDKKHSSAKNITSFISMTVHDIIDIDELHMSYTVSVEIKLKWFDSRLIFRNLKQRYYENQLNKLEIDEIWTPMLFFGDSNNIYMKAGQEADGIFGEVSVHKEGSSNINDFSEIDEDYLYQGMENPLRMKNYIIIKLGCKFDLRWYPFDIQKCQIKLYRPKNFYNQFVMEWNDPPVIKDIELTQYDVLKSLRYDNTTSSKTMVEIEITLCRKLSYHVVNIYIPTLCLVMIAGFTLFIDGSHFEVTIMVALTSMLVTYTLYQSLSTYLPQTSYMKMIDIWLFVGLIFPFLNVTILVIMDALIMREKDEVIDIKLNGKININSDRFMRSMQIILSTIGGIFCVIYWIFGLHHYHFACTN